METRYTLRISRDMMVRLDRTLTRAVFGKATDYCRIFLELSEWGLSGFSASNGLSEQGNED